MKKMVRIFGFLVLGTLISYIGLLGLLTFIYEEVLDYEVTTCISPSMEPTIMTNGWVVTDHSVPFDEIEESDIIMFKADGYSRPVNHRVYQVSPTEEKTVLTKGDNKDNGIDPWSVSEETYVGKVVGYTNFPVLFNDILCGDMFNNNTTGRKIVGSAGLVFIGLIALGCVLVEKIEGVFKNFRTNKKEGHKNG